MKKKHYWEMNTDELAVATREFDLPSLSAKAVKPTVAQRSQLRRWQQKRAAARSRLTLSLEKDLIQQTDEYAVNHCITFSDVVSNALRKLMKKKSA